MRPPPTNHQFGDDNLKHRQASSEHRAIGSPGTPRARLAVRPLLRSHQSSIRVTRTQLRTQNTMGTGGGAAVTQSTVRYHRIILSLKNHPFFIFFQDTAFGQTIQSSRIVGRIQGRKPRRQQALRTEGHTQVEPIYDHYTCFIYLYVTCPWIGHVK